MNTYKITVSKISCSNCAMTITRALQDFDENAQVRVSVITSKVFINTEFSKQEIYQVLKQAGYPADDDGASKQKLNLRKYDLPISIICALPLLYSMFHLPYLHWLTTPAPTLVFASIIQFYIGRRYYQGAYKSLQKKMFGMDFLVVFSTTITYFFSLYLLIAYQGNHQLYFEVSAIIITIVLIGKTIEERVKDKTNELLTKLTQLTTGNIQLVDGSECDVNFVEIGTEYIVNPHQKINMDGILKNVDTVLDESMLTGESNYITKRIGDEVIAGTINHGSQIVIETTKYFEDNYINQIINSVEEASLIDTKFQKLADRVATIFVPVIIAIGLITFVITFWITGNILLSFEHAMAVIVISCPCSLGLATPTSIMVSNSISAKLGILYKGSTFFEMADKLTIIAFDKTGTLTTGKMEVVEFNVPEQYIPDLYAMESQSSHPISTAICGYIGKPKSESQLQVTQVAGIGLEATTSFGKMVVGNPNILQNQVDIDLINNLEAQALTISVILVDDVMVGYYGLRDEIKPESPTVIQKLKNLGIEPVLISGDNQQVVTFVAKKLGIKRFYYKTSPEDKYQILKDLKGDDDLIGFVGDGINDSISLKFADVGISVAGGSDIASAASDVTLLKDDLGLVVEGIKLSNLTRRNIKSNFLWAFSYNIIAIPLAATGQLNMIWAAVFMGFSSIVVVLNALRLKAMYLREKNDN